MNNKKMNAILPSLPTNANASCCSNVGLTLVNRMIAFTLAEVLITLTIIGVVAAVTVPTLTKKTGNQEYVTRLQKVYSVLSQATDEIILEKGQPRNNWAANTTTIYNSYKEHLRISKDCGTSAGCYKQDSIDGVDDNDLDLDNSFFQKFILSDGSQIFFASRRSDCSYTGHAGSIDVCATIYVDITGQKGPNILGRDFFAFVLKNDGLHPRGCDLTKDSNGNTKEYCQNGKAYECACRVITEGEMNY